MVRFQPTTRRLRKAPRLLILVALVASVLFVAPGGAGANSARSQSVSPEAVALCTAYESVVVQAAGDSLDPAIWSAALDSVEQGLDDIGPSPSGLYLTIDVLREATETPIMVDGEIFAGLGYLNGVCSIVRGTETSSPATTVPQPTNSDSSPAQTDGSSTPGSPVDEASTSTTVPQPTPPDSSSPDVVDVPPEAPTPEPDVAPPPADDRTAVCSAYSSVVLQALGVVGESEVDPVAWAAALDQLELELDNIGPSPAGLYFTIDELRGASPTTPVVVFGEVFLGIDYLDGFCFPRDDSFIEFVDEVFSITSVCTALSTVGDASGNIVDESEDVFLTGSTDTGPALNLWISTFDGSDPVATLNFVGDDIVYVADGFTAGDDGLSGRGSISIDEIEFPFSYAYSPDIPCDDGSGIPTPTSFITTEEILPDGSIIADVYEISSVCRTTPVIGAQDTIVTANLAETDAPPITMTLSFDEGFRGVTIVGFGTDFVSATDPATDFPEDFFLDDGAASGDGTLFSADGTALSISFSFAQDVPCDEINLPFDPPLDPGSYLAGDTGGPLFATCANIAPSGQYTIRTDVDGTLAPGGPEVGNYLVLHPVGGNRSYLIIGYDANDQARVFISPDEMTVSSDIAAFYLTFTGTVRTFSSFGDTTTEEFSMALLLSSVGRCNDLTDLADDSSPGVGQVLMDGFGEFESPEFDGLWDVFFACVDVSEEGSSFVYELVIDTNPNDESDETPGLDEFRTASVSMLAQDGNLEVSLLSGDSFLSDNVALDVSLETDEVLVGAIQSPAVTMAFWVPLVGPRCT